MLGEQGAGQGSAPPVEQPLVDEAALAQAIALWQRCSQELCARDGQQQLSSQALMASLDDTALMSALSAGLSKRLRALPASLESIALSQDFERAAQQAWNAHQSKAQSLRKQSERLDAYLSNTQS